jgi:hypothetical protein
MYIPMLGSIQNQGQILAGCAFKKYSLYEKFIHKMLYNLINDEDIE